VPVSCFLHADNEMYFDLLRIGTKRTRIIQLYSGMRISRQLLNNRTKSKTSISNTRRDVISIEQGDINHYVLIFKITF